jgi:hypothetical protein
MSNDREIAQTCIMVKGKEEKGQKDVHQRLGPCIDRVQSARRRMFGPVRNQTPLPIHNHMVCIKKAMSVLRAESWTGDGSRWRGNQDGLHCLNNEFLVPDIQYILLVRLFPYFQPVDMLDNLSLFATTSKSQVGAFFLHSFRMGL